MVQAKCEDDTKRSFPDHFNAEKVRFLGKEIGGHPPTDVLIQRRLPLLRSNDGGQLV
jgi:hypothetical protein